MTVSALLLSAGAIRLDATVRPYATSDEPMNSPVIAGAGVLAVALLIPWSSWCGRTRSAGPPAAVGTMRCTFRLDYDASS